MKPRKLTGCIPDLPDIRDYKFKRPMMSYISSPILVDWTSYFMEPKDQKNEGICVGMTAAALREAACVRAETSKDWTVDMVDLSERFVYEEAKKRDIWAGESYSGTSIKAAMKTMRQIGICYEDDWPFVPNKKGTPKTGYQLNASLYRIREYRKIGIKTSTLRAALAKGPIAIGIVVPSTLFSVDKQRGIVKSTSDIGNHGAHAVCLVGYDDVLRLFKVRNSWGTKWGVDGYCYFSYEFLPKITFSAWQMYL